MRARSADNYRFQLPLTRRRRPSAASSVPRSRSRDLDRELARAGGLTFRPQEEANATSIRASERSTCKSTSLSRRTMSDATSMPCATGRWRGSADKRSGASLPSHLAPPGRRSPRRRRTRFGRRRLTRISCLSLTRRRGLAIEASPRVPRSHQCREREMNDSPQPTHPFL